MGERLPLVLHTLYLLFNEGYTTSSGPDLTRSDLSGEAIRLVRQVHAALPEDQEVAALLALMVLTDARRGARTDEQGHLVPLADQDRARWDRRLIAEGMGLVTDALRRGPIGEYLAQAAIAAVHAEAADAATTDWAQIRRLYDVLEARSSNPMVTLNRAVAVAMSSGPSSRGPTRVPRTELISLVGCACPDTGRGRRHPGSPRSTRPRRGPCRR